MKYLIMSSVLAGLAVGCASSESSNSNSDAVLAKDFVTEVKVKTMKDIKEYTEHPENNVIVTHTMEYEGDVLKQVIFEGTDSVSGYITIERDDAGNIVKTETFFNKPDGPEKTMYDEFTYEKGYLVAQKHYYLYEGKYMTMGDYKYEYNDKGQLLKKDAFTGTGQPEKTYSYEYTDDSTNPTVVHRDHLISGTDYTSTYEYETTTSPLIVYLLIRGYVESALTKKNVKKATSAAAGAEKQDVSIYEYTYNENNLPTKISMVTPSMKQGWEFTY